MFFRRPKVEAPDFNKRLEDAARAGFSVERRTDGTAQLCSKRYAASVRDAAPGVIVDSIGRIMHGEVAVLEDGGFQKFWNIGGRRCGPALAAQLEEMHAFEEDLKEALRIESWYNTSLGTTNRVHHYDRLAGRES